jgi:hypothetical protein
MCRELFVAGIINRISLAALTLWIAPAIMIVVMAIDTVTLRIFERKLISYCKWTVLLHAVIGGALTAAESDQSIAGFWRRRDNP